MLRNNNLHAPVARRRPFISKKNKILCFKFATEFLNKDKLYWDRVLFSDKNKYIFGNDGRKRVWRIENTELEVINLQSTIKHSGGSVMVWVCMTDNYVRNLMFIDGVLDKMEYLKVLQNNLKDSVSKLNLATKF